MSNAAGYRNKVELSMYSPIGRKVIEQFETDRFFNAYDSFLSFAGGLARIFVFSTEERPKQAYRMDMIIEMGRTNIEINKLSQMFRLECQRYPISLPEADF